MLAACPDLNTCAALGAVRQWLDHQFADMRVAPEFKIGTAITSGPQESFCGIPAPTTFLVDFKVANALIAAAVEVFSSRYTGLDGRL